MIKEVLLTRKDNHNRRIEIRLQRVRRGESQLVVISSMQQERMASAKDLLNSYLYLP